MIFVVIHWITMKKPVSFSIKADSLPPLGKSKKKVPKLTPF